MRLRLHLRGSKSYNYIYLESYFFRNKIIPLPFMNQVIICKKNLSIKTGSFRDSRSVIHTFNVIQFYYVSIHFYKFTIYSHLRKFELSSNYLSMPLVW